MFLVKRYFPSQDCIYDLFQHFTLILLASKHLRRLDYHSLICGGKGKRLNRLWRTTQWITCDNGRKKRKRRETAFPAFHLLSFSPFRLSAFPKSALRIYILKNRTENRFPDVPFQNERVISKENIFRTVCCRACRTVRYSSFLDNSVIPEQQRLDPITARCNE